jgi:hypothetical protein
MWTCCVFHVCCFNALCSIFSWRTKKKWHERYLFNECRTKLKQTEVDCEYLKRCCETLTEENRRLQKEVQELRALKLSPQLYMQMNPPTTLTMCPSCERVAVSSASSSSAAAPSAPAPADCNPPGSSVQRPVPLNPWAAMSSQNRTRPWVFTHDPSSRVK